jgi:hypothetical protein
MNYEIYDDETLAAFRESAPDPALLAVVEQLVTRTKNQELWDSTCLVVGEPSPGLLGFDPMTDPPDWAWRTEHGGWVELGLLLDEFSWILLVPTSSSLAQQV